MKCQSFFLTCLLMILVQTGFCFSNRIDVERKIERSFTAGPNSRLQVSNKYGNISIITWAKSEVKFSIQIIGGADSKEDAQKLADRVDIKFSQDGDLISAESIFNQVKLPRSRNTSTEVHYTINVPLYVGMNLTNKYGNINLEDTPKPFVCTVQYGNLQAHDLTSTSNQITCKYGNVNVNNVAEGNITLGYGNIQVYQANRLDITTSYSNAKIEEVTKLTSSSKYDNYTVGTVGEFSLNSGSYGGFKIGKLLKMFSAPSMKYGNIRISEVAKNFESIRIDAGYTNIRVNISSESYCQTDLSTRYGNIQISKQLNTSALKFSDEEGTFTKSATGVIGGQKGPKSIISISNSYSDIHLGI